MQKSESRQRSDLVEEANAVKKVDARPSRVVY